MLFPNRSLEHIKIQRLQKVLASELGARLLFTRKPCNKGPYLCKDLVCRISVKILYNCNWQKMLVRWAGHNKHFWIIIPSCERLPQTNQTSLYSCSKYRWFSASHHHFLGTAWSSWDWSMVLLGHMQNHATPWKVSGTSLRSVAVSWPPSQRGK